MKLKYFIEFLEQFYFKCDVASGILTISDKHDGKIIFTYVTKGEIIDLLDFIAYLLIIKSMSK